MRFMKRGWCYDVVFVIIEFLGCETGLKGCQKAFRTSGKCMSQVYTLPLNVF